MSAKLSKFQFPTSASAEGVREGDNVRCILVETTVPVKIRPRIETIPVKGHFLSMYEPSMAFLGVRKPRPTSLCHLLVLVFFLGPVALWLWKM